MLQEHTRAIHDEHSGNVRCWSRYSRVSNLGNSSKADGSSIIRSHRQLRWSCRDQNDARTAIDATITCCRFCAAHATPSTRAKRALLLSATSGKHLPSRVVYLLLLYWPRGPQPEAAQSYFPTVQEIREYRNHLIATMQAHRFTCVCSRVKCNVIWHSCGRI